MRFLKFLAVVVILALPVSGIASGVSVPDGATWYFHADFDAMRKGKASKGLYDWLNAEVFTELRDELGIDFDKEARRLTAFSGTDQGPVIVIDGKFSQETKDKIIAVAAMDGEVEPFKASGKTYYFFNSDGESDVMSGGDIDIDLESLEDEAYVSVAVKDKIIITHSRAQMEVLLKENGRIETKGDSKNALFVLQAERNLVQAGVNAEHLQDEGDWDSNILKNTRQLAFLIADLGDKLGFEAQLLTTEPEMANSLASIVRGLISLQAFDDDADPDLKSVLQSTKVDVTGSTLKVALALAPELVVSALED